QHHHRNAAAERGEHGAGPADCDDGVDAVQQLVEGNEIDEAHLVVVDGQGRSVDLVVDGGDDVGVDGFHRLQDAAEQLRVAEHGAEGDQDQRQVLPPGEVRRAPRVTVLTVRFGADADAGGCGTPSGGLQ